MGDDIFSRLFELFDQPGPVNFKLATELVRHLTGDRQPVEPWAAEELRDLTRLAEFRVEQVAPFRVVPARDVVPVDARDWAERNLEGFRYLAEPFAGMIEVGGAAPAALFLDQIGPAVVGLQVGTLVGTLARWVMASFEAGVPVTDSDHITYVVPNIDAFTTRHGLDPHEVRLWVALHETAHRAMFGVPFTFEHLCGLVSDYAATLRVDPARLGELMGGLDPAGLANLDTERLAELFDNPESRRAQAELVAFLGLTGGYRRLLVERAAESMIDHRGIEALRMAERDLDLDSSPVAATFVSADHIGRGYEFCLEVERRWGTEELGRMWSNQGRFPKADELDDPVAWAARVLLDDLG